MQRLKGRERLMVAIPSCQTPQRNGHRGIRPTTIPNQMVYALDIEYHIRRMNAHEEMWHDVLRSLWPLWLHRAIAQYLWVRTCHPDQCVRRRGCSRVGQLKSLPWKCTYYCVSCFRPEWRSRYSLTFTCYFPLFAMHSMTCTDNDEVELYLS